MSVYSSGVRSIRSAVRGTRRWSDESMYVSILPPQGSGASSSRSGLPGAPSVRTRSRVVRRMRLWTVVLAPMKSFCPAAESFDATRGVDSKLDAPVQHTQHAPMCSRGPSPATSFVPLKLAKDGVCQRTLWRKIVQNLIVYCASGGGHLVKASDIASCRATSRRTSNC